MYWIELMKYQVHELEKMDKTDEIVLFTSEGPQPILVEPSWPGLVSSKASV